MPVVTVLKQSATVAKTKIRLKGVRLGTHLNHTIGTRLHHIRIASLVQQYSLALSMNKLRLKIIRIVVLTRLAPYILWIGVINIVLVITYMESHTTAVAGNLVA